MNDSSRKFDRLRWKYIGAYVDCMKLCGRRSILETFLKWCDNSSRDLPSFYIATAKEGGKTPQNSHSTENMVLLEGKGGLIYFAMKYTNEAIAHIVRKESMAISLSHPNNAHEKEYKEWMEQTTDLMKDAYKCFVRLNCPIDENLWQSRKVRQKMTNGHIPEIEALCSTYMTWQKVNPKSLSKITSWEDKILLLRSAVKECEKLFPTITFKSTSLSQKRKRKKESSTSTTTSSSKDGGGSKSKDSESKTTQRKIIVKVPSGVKEGETFIVQVCCEYYRNMVQLVASRSKRIVFHLDLPENITSEVKVSYVNKEQ